jgi:predicted ATPase
MTDTRREGNLTVVVTDIEGSTKLLRALGDDYAGVLSRHHTLIRNAMTARGGTEVGTEGDAFVVLFDHADDAVLACLTAQRDLAAEKWHGDANVKVRMGIHVGDVRPGGDNYVGLGIHQSRRVASAGHGGQVLVSAAAAEELHGLLPEDVGLHDLGAFHLRDFDDRQRLWQLLHPDLPRVFPPPRATSAAVHNLPPARTAFIGRGSELNALVKATDVSPLVTIVGPPGIGKTRLASELGLMVAGRYDVGVWLVSLASLNEPSGVAQRVKSTMGIPDDPTASATQSIADALQAGAGLIILDNCEHVLDGCVALVETLLGASAATRVVATSREHLDVSGEEVFRLGPLDLPPDDADLEPGAAFELFVDRAARAQQNFVLSAESANTAASICRRLDGIPLALELAAARLATMSLAQLDARIDDALGLLDTGRRGGEERQRTLRATVDWSHRLLDDDEQMLFRSLSVFRGGFDLDAAAAIVERRDVAVALEHLVAQSLLEFDPVATPPRYRLLEPIRQYAAEQLAAHELAPVQAAHAAFFVGVAHDCVDAGLGTAELERIDAEHANLLVALDYLAAATQPVAHGRLVINLCRVWMLRSQWRLARDELVRYLARPDRDRALEARCAERLGAVAWSLGEFAEAQTNYEHARQIAHELDDRTTEAACVQGIGNAAYSVGDLPGAQRHYEAALGIVRALGDRRVEASLVGNLGSVAYGLGDYAEARRRYTDGLTIARERGDRVSEATCAANLGNAALALGDYDEARLRYTEGLTIGHELGARRVEAFCAANLGNVAVSIGDYAEARRRYETALGVARELGDRSLESHCVGDLGSVARELGDFPAAQTCLTEALAIVRELGERRFESHWLLHLGSVALELGDADIARRHIGDALRIAIEVDKHDANLLEAAATLLARTHRCEEALELLAAADAEHARFERVRSTADQARFDAVCHDCRAQLTNDAAAAAWARGDAFDWPTAASRALGRLDAP